MRIRSAVAAVLLVAIALAGLGAGIWYRSVKATPASAAIDPVITIRSGDTVGSIADRLVDQGIISSGWPLVALSRVRDTQGNFQLGTFRVPDGASVVEVHDYLTAGNQLLHDVTIPEGWTSRRIAAHLEAEGFVSAEAFLDAVRNPNLPATFDIPGGSAEGYLFPDTYRIPREMSPQRIVEMMVRQAFAVLDDIGAGDLSVEDRHNAVILASIIEREYRVPGEAPMIASVFYNRLNLDMRLESCATVLYVMTEEQGLPHPERLYYRDLDRESEFNTYIHRGLPPAPIANPGREALSGAVNPAVSDYLYFVWQGPGSESHYFSRTLSEHSDAALRYLKQP